MGEDVAPTAGGRGCLVLDRRGKVLIGCQCGQAATSLYPRRLIRCVCPRCFGTGLRLSCAGCVAGVSD